MPFLMSDERNRVHGAGYDGRITRDFSALLSLVIPTMKSSSLRAEPRASLEI